jgi:hypothetical protein
MHHKGTTLLAATPRRRKLRPPRTGSMVNAVVQEAFRKRRPEDSRLLFWFLPILSSLLLLDGAPIFAQQQAAPALHRRVEANSIDEADSTTVSRGRTTLPLDASGEYSLGESGEAVEIDLEPNHLGGYISRFGDRMSDQGTPLTFFFATSALNGQQLSFTTRKVHGVWFSFVGTIVRGNASTKAEEGYYRLQGRMVLHDDANGTQQQRDVSLPMTKQYSNG